MVETRTARMRLVQWSSGTDSPQRVDFNETFLNIENQAAIDQQGVILDRPLANKIGMYYFATDQGILYRSDGVNWAVVGSATLSHLVRAAKTGDTSLIVQAIASQTGDLLRVSTTAGGTHLRVRSNGDLLVGAMRISQAARATTTSDTAPTDSAVTVDNNSASMWGHTSKNTTGNTTGYYRAIRGTVTVFFVGPDGSVSTPSVTLTTEPSVAGHATTKKYVDDTVAGRTYALTSDQLTGVLSVAKGGTGGTTEATARAGIGAAAAATTINTGDGLVGGGALSANRTLSVTFASGSAWGADQGSSTLVARYDHEHNLDQAKIIGTLPASKGGTGRSTVTAGAYLRGTSAGGAYEEITPSNLRTDIGAAASGHGHALTDANITGILPVAQGGTNATTVAAARTNLGVPWNGQTIATGDGLTGGGNLTANRTLSVVFAGTGSANTVARSDHKHVAQDIVDRLTAAQLPEATELPGGMDLDTLTETHDYTQTSSAEAGSGTNYPTGLAGWLRVVTSSSGTMTWQKYTLYNPSNPTEYVRTRYGGTWGAWRQMADVNDIAALVNVYAAKDHGHSLADANITGVLPLAQGGTGATTAAAARTALAVPSTSVSVVAGAGLSGGGTLAASRTLQVVFEGSGSKSTSARSDHGHALTDANVTGILPPVQGGTGRAGITAGNYITGDGNNPVIGKTPAQVLSDIGAATSGHGHALTDANITGTLPTSQGGTGRTSNTLGSYLIGGGTGALGLKTPSEVLSDIGAATSGHGHALTDANITGILPIVQGGTGGATVLAARQNIGAAGAATEIIAGTGLSGGGALGSSGNNTTLSIVYPSTSFTIDGSSTGTSDIAARYDHKHNLTGSYLEGNLPWTKAPVPINLTTEDLNTVTATAVYHQATNANATAARNYPSTVAGKLEVWSIGLMIYQEYTDYTSNGAVWRRSKYSSNAWYGWKRMVQMDDLDQVEVVLALSNGHVPDVAGRTPLIIREGRKRTIYGRVKPSNGGEYGVTSSGFQPFSIPAGDRPIGATTFIGVGSGFSSITTVRFEARSDGTFVFAPSSSTPWVSFDGMNWLV